MIGRQRATPRMLLVVAAVLVLTALCAPVHGQDRVTRIGVLVFRVRALTALPDVLARTLREHGFVDGQNTRIDYRFAEGRTERIAGLAAELVRLKPAVIVAEDTPAAQGAKNATKTIPIVMVAGDPVATGIVESLARPGGNVTGIAGLGNEVAGKNLQLFREIVPHATRVVVATRRTDAFGPLLIEQTRQAGVRLKIDVHEVIADMPDQPDAILAEVRKANASGLILQPALATVGLAEAALRARVPAMSSTAAFVRAGGLMAYGANREDLYRKMALSVVKILKGARPAELPIEQPTQFDFAINLKTAKALGLTIPQALVLQADPVIQ